MRCDIRYLLPFRNYLFSPQAPLVDNCGNHLTSEAIARLERIDESLDREGWSTKYNANRDSNLWYGIAGKKVLDVRFLPNA